MAAIVEGIGLTSDLAQVMQPLSQLTQSISESKRCELVMLMGDSGCGKTTLISLLGCILTPDDGELELMVNRLIRCPKT